MQGNKRKHFGVLDGKGDASGDDKFYRRYGRVRYLAENSGSTRRKSFTMIIKSIRATGKILP